MVPQGIEMVVGARNDPLFGPLIVVGLGGVLVEVLKDTALSPAPVTPSQAEGLLRQLKGIKLLEGFRGMPAVNIQRLAKSSAMCLVSLPIIEIPSPNSTSIRLFARETA